MSCAPVKRIVDSAARCLLPGTEQYQQGGRMPAIRLSAVNLPVYVTLGSGFRVDLVPLRTTARHEALLVAAFHHSDFTGPREAASYLCQIEPLSATLTQLGQGVLSGPSSQPVIEEASRVVRCERLHHGRAIGRQRMSMSTSAARQNCPATVGQCCVAAPNF